LPYDDFMMVSRPVRPEPKGTMPSQGLLQRRRGQVAESTGVPPAVHDVLRSSGAPLPSPVRAFMESRFQQDFGKVRVHTDDQAAESAQAVGARAYTVGRDIVFNQGQYTPESAAGRSLLAHELTHMVQQGVGAASPSRIGDPGTFAEREADRAAGVVASGGTLSPKPTPSPAGLQRDDLPEMKLKPPTLQAPRLRGPSLFPPGQGPRLSLRLEDELLKKRGVSKVRPIPGALPLPVEDAVKPDPLKKVPGGKPGTGPEPKEKMEPLWQLKFELDIEKGSALSQLLEKQSRLEELTATLSGEKTKDSPLALELINAGVNILSVLPPISTGREKLHSLLGVENISVVINPESKTFGAFVTFRFGGKRK
jgi:hypothetical protein